MRIGIDIDDTITNTWEHFIPFFLKTFNIPLDKLKESTPYYESVKDIISCEEYYELIRKHEYLTESAPLKENVKEIITKLKEEGHTIIFITARSTSSYSDPYQISKKYLDKYQIPYDKIVVNGLDKGTLCKEEKIDLFIDDSIRNCTDVSNQGIDVLMVSTKFNESNKNFVHMNDWKQVYKYIKKR